MSSGPIVVTRSPRPSSRKRSPSAACSESTNAREMLGVRRSSSSSPSQRVVDRPPLVVLIERVVAEELIGVEAARPVDVLAHRVGERERGPARNVQRDDAALALDHADDRLALVGVRATVQRPSLGAGLAPLAFADLPADPG